MQRTAVGSDGALLFRHDTVGFRPPVTEKAPGKTFFTQAIQIEGSIQDFLGISSGRCHEFTGCIGNKGRTVESKRRGLAAIFFTGHYGFSTNPVCSSNRNKICGRMSLHNASPVPAAVYIQDRLTSDSGRIEQDFSTLNGHASCCFRKPLIPADADADGSETCFKDLESRISRSEIEFS